MGYLIFCHSYERPASKCQLRNVLTYLPLEREDFFIFGKNCQCGSPRRSASVYNLREMTPLPSPYPFTPPALIIAERSFLPPPQRREQDQRGRGWHCRQGGRRWLACCGAATRSILEAGLLPDGVADVAKVATLECAPGNLAHEGHRCALQALQHRVGRHPTSSPAVCRVLDECVSVRRLPAQLLAYSALRIFD